MSITNSSNLSHALIEKLGIRLSHKSFFTQIAPNARVFEYPEIENIYLMESDLYGNPMPIGSVFLAFNGRAGLMGKHIRIETLENSSRENIMNIVAENHSG